MCRPSHGEDQDQVLMLPAGLPADEGGCPSEAITLMPAASETKGKATEHHMASPDPLKLGFRERSRWYKDVRAASCSRPVVKWVLRRLRDVNPVRRERMFKL